jgi:hypothetical protein
MYDNLKLFLEYVKEIDMRSKLVFASTFYNCIKTFGNNFSTL